MDELPPLEDVSKPRRGRRSNAEIQAEVEALRAEAAAERAASPSIPKPASDEPEEKGYELYASVPPPKLVAMELKRHYRPSGYFEIVGYNQEERTRKGVTGLMEVVVPAAFIAKMDEETGKIGQAPPPMPGVQFKDKIWAGTVIRVTPEEAKKMRANNIAERSVDD